jgi:diguanylate cyclase (GGDEF)-like protein
MTDYDVAYGDEVILVVDDEEGIRGPVTKMLQHLGFRAEAASDGREAVEALKENRFTFLLTDIQMPEMNGLELISHVRSEYPNVCSIAMTGYEKEFKYIDVINAGATDFVNKPFGMEELEAKLKRAIVERNTRQELSKLSITDALTGLYNQRHFYARLRDEMKRAERQKHALALILLDLDDFKQYNDTYGHLAGDKLLSNIGAIIQSSIREGVDSGYRYGGDEFAVILIDADVDISQGIGKRIERAIVKECGITASMGYSSFSDETSPEELVNRADQKLYKFKGARKMDKQAQGHKD